jgi:hypothetical protein
MFINIFSTITCNKDDGLIFNDYTNAPVAGFYPEKKPLFRRFEFFQIWNVS